MLDDTHQQRLDDTHEASLRATKNCVTGTVSTKLCQRNCVNDHESTTKHCQPSMPVWRVNTALSTLACEHWLVNTGEMLVDACGHEMLVDACAVWMLVGARESSRIQPRPLILNPRPSTLDPQP
jgi:hypothetical protein